MNQGLLSQLNSLFDEQLTKGLSTILDEKTATIQKALSTLFPTMVGGLAKTISKEKNASALSFLLPKFDSRILDQIPEVWTDKKQQEKTLQSGDKVLNHIFSDNRNKVLYHVADELAIAPEKTEKLAKLTAPLLMAQLANLQKENNLSNTEVANVILGEKKQILKHCPAKIVDFLGLEKLNAQLNDVKAVENTVQTAAHSQAETTSIKSKTKATTTTSNTKKTATTSSSNSWYRWLPLLLLFGVLAFVLYMFTQQNNTTTSTQVAKSTNTTGIQSNNTTTANQPVVKKVADKGEKVAISNPQIQLNQQQTGGDKKAAKKAANKKQQKTPIDRGEKMIDVEYDKNGRKLIKDRKGRIQNTVPPEQLTTEQLKDATDLSNSGETATAKATPSLPTLDPKTLKLNTGSTAKTMFDFLATGKKEFSNIFLLKDVQFDESSNDLLSESYPALDELVKLMQAYPDLAIKFMGHVHPSPDKRRDVNATGKRANQVKKYLINAGIEYERVRHERYGGENPLVKNDGSEEAKQKNTRIEVMITRM